MTEEVEKPVEKPRRPSHASTSASTSSDSSTSHNVASATGTSHRPVPLPGSQEEAEGMDSLSLRKTRSRALERADTALSRIRSRAPIAPFSHPLVHEKTGLDYIVDFDGPDDPYRPMNWSFKKKVITTAMYGFTTMGATFNSSVFSPATDQVAAEFHVGSEVATLGTALLIFGFGIGPLIWAPLSELYGRRPAVLVPFFISAIFTFGAGASSNIQTLCITRFFAGLFGAAPITNTGGVLGDIWSPQQRGVAIVGYAMAVVGGPTLGPIVGGVICQSSLGWRWTQYITGIFMMVMLFLDVLVLDESYPNSLLVVKAQRLRHEYGNWALHARHEEWNPNIREIGKKYMIRPFQLLATPICFLVALYASFVYGILYACLGAFPVEFQEVRGWNQVVGALPFLAQLLGVCLAAVFNILNQKYYFKCFKANNNRAVPEARLPPMMGGSVVFSAGLFIFAWTSSASIHWICPCIGIVLFGMGFFLIFQAALNYLIDTFQSTAASAVAANTFLRSVMAGAFPLFITPCLHNLGIDWGMSIFAFFSIALIPIPYLFFIYGKRIRARGYWSKESVT